MRSSISPITRVSLGRCSKRRMLTSPVVMTCAAVDVGDPGHRHEDLAPPEHLDHQPEHARLAALRTGAPPRGRAPCRPGRPGGRRSAARPGGPRRRGEGWCSRERHVSVWRHDARLIFPSTSSTCSPRRRSPATSWPSSTAPTTSTTRSGWRSRRSSTTPRPRSPRPLGPAAYAVRIFTPWPGDRRSRATRPWAPPGCSATAATSPATTATQHCGAGEVRGAPRRRPGRADRRRRATSPGRCRSAWSTSCWPTTGSAPSDRAGEAWVAGAGLDFVHVPVTEEALVAGPARHPPAHVVRRVAGGPRPARRRQPGRDGAGQPSVDRVDVHSPGVRPGPDRGPRTPPPAPPRPGSA